jgi:small subunit ribosomal protein S20
MPITKSAKKAVRRSLRQKAQNDQWRRRMKTAIKKIEKTAQKDKKEAGKLLNVTFQIIDKATKKGVIKKNNAARKKSRLSKLVE